MLPYLKDCLEALAFNSVLDNEIIICNDGSTDGTKQFLHPWAELNGIKVIDRESRGCFSGWNECAKLSTKEWLMAWQDDMHALPNWDSKLMTWIQADPSKQYGIGIVEPYWGSYVQYDCGTTPATFNEAKAVQYVNSISSHTAKRQVFAHSAISREDWRTVGGLDERFDPTLSGWPDFQESLHKLRPREWLIVNDSWLYHSRHGKEKPFRVEPHHDHNMRLFFEKWGVHVGPEHEARLNVSVN